SVAQQSNGRVVQVDASAQARAAFTAWDASPCDINAAQHVTQAINAEVDTVIPAVQRAQLQQIVLVGDDDEIPMARVSDGTKLSNEADYASEVVRRDSPDPSVVSATPQSTALANHYLLTDDPYGDFDPIPWKQDAVYVPDVALGRLVETPADIQLQLEQ